VLSTPVYFSSQSRNLLFASNTRQEQKAKPCHHTSARPAIAWHLVVVVMIDLDTETAHTHTEEHRTKVQPIHTLIKHCTSIFLRSSCTGRDTGPMHDDAYRWSMIDDYPWHGSLGFSGKPWISRRYGHPSFCCRFLRGRSVGSLQFPERGEWSVGSLQFQREEEHLGLIAAGPPKLFSWQNRSCCPLTTKPVSPPPALTSFFPAPSVDDDQRIFVF
jgi:hypothetical protein